MKGMILTALLAVSAILGMRAADVPAYPGGQEAMKAFIAKNIQYPPAAKEMGVEGIVKVAFVVNADGTLTDIRIVRLIDPDLEAEAKRIVTKMPAWTPADNEGVPVAAKAEVEIPFVID